MSPRTLAAAEATRIFSTTSGYTAIWEALVDVLEWRYLVEHACKVQVIREPEGSRIDRWQGPQT